MTGMVVDASVAVKWLVPEVGTAAALALRRHRLTAPDLLTAECANVLWKMVKRGELSPDEAQAAARLLAVAEIELVPMRGLLASAVRWATRLSHPAYDCFYVALAELRAVPLMTADASLRRRLQMANVREVSVLDLIAVG
jgi:predicted nucleic acid-binding protein